MINIKNFFIVIFLGGIGFYLFVAFQMIHKPWIQTELILMSIKETNVETLISNKRDSILVHEYIVKNPPYTLKGRYEMVNDFLKEQGELFPESGAHRVSYIFTQEGWYFNNNFPYVDYIDRTYLEKTITNQEYNSYYDGQDPTGIIPYGGANGFSGKGVAEFEIDSISSECRRYSSLIISRPFLSIAPLVENLEYDDSLGASFFFSSGDYAPVTPKCEGVIHEGVSSDSGLRF